MLVNHFETLVSQHMGLPSQICIYNEFCGKGIAVEHVAAFIPATIMFTPSIDWERCEKSRLRKWSSLQPKLSSATPSQKTLRRYCRECSYLKDCWGECPKNRLIRTPDGEAGLNYLCAGLKKFNKLHCQKPNKSQTKFVNSKTHVSPKHTTAGAAHQTHSLTITGCRRADANSSAALNRSECRLRHKVDAREPTTNARCYIYYAYTA